MGGSSPFLNKDVWCLVLAEVNLPLARRTFLVCSRIFLLCSQSLVVFLPVVVLAEMNDQIIRKPKTGKILEACVTCVSPTSAIIFFCRFNIWVGFKGRQTQKWKNSGNRSYISANFENLTTDMYGM